MAMVCACVCAYVVGGGGDAAAWQLHQTCSRWCRGPTILAARDQHAMVAPHILSGVAYCGMTTVGVHALHPWHAFVVLADDDVAQQGLGSTKA